VRTGGLCTCVRCWTQTIGLYRNCSHTWSKWQFRPAKVDGVPGEVEVLLLVPPSFRPLTVGASNPRE